MASSATVLLLPLCRLQFSSMRGCSERKTAACQGWATKPLLCANCTGSSPSRRSSIIFAVVIVIACTSFVLHSSDGDGVDRLRREQRRDHIAARVGVRGERMQNEAAQVLPFGAAGD